MGSLVAVFENENRWKIAEILDGSIQRILFYIEKLSTPLGEDAL
jgi:hypothetical protein